MKGRYYTLTVDQNFEYGHCYSVQIREGDTYIKPWLGDRFMEPGRFGYVFAGWCHDPEGKIPVAKDEKMQKDEKIYATWEKLDEKTAEWMKSIGEEARAVRYICDRPNAYTKESFQKYFDLSTGMMFMTMGGQVFPKEMEGLVTALREARKNLKLKEKIKDPEDMPRSNKEVF